MKCFSCIFSVISTILRNAFPYICWEVMVNMLVVMEFCVFIFSNGCLNWKIYSLVQLKTKVTLVIGIRNLLNLLWISCFFFFFSFYFSCWALCCSVDIQRIRYNYSLFAARTSSSSYPGYQFWGLLLSNCVAERPIIWSLSCA